MVYLLQYRGDPPGDAGRRVRIALSIWEKRRGKGTRPDIIIVPPEEIEDFREVAEQQKLILKPDQEFKIRHGKYHFALDSLKKD